MSRRCTEQWERRKWYLLRSLFDEDPELSPIPERQELLLNSSIIELNRPFSPLPDLIIEKEPNKHDEPEEFYQELEREVLELHRNLFLDSENSLQCSERPQSSDKANISIGNCNDQHSSNSKSSEGPSNCPFEKSSTYEEEQSNEEISNEIQNKIKLTDTSVEEGTTSESHNNEIIVVQALVHQADNEESNNDSRHMSRMHDIYSEIQNLSANTEESDEQSEDEHMQTDIEDSRFSNSEQHKVLDLPKDKDTTLVSGCVTDASSTPEDPEIMRRRETSNDTLQSISDMDVGKHFSDFSGDKTTSIRALDEAEIYSYESSIILRNTSITKTSGIVRKGDRKRRISREMYSHQCRPSLIEKKFENKVTQTDFSSSDDEDNWRAVLKRVFKGNPRIFKLCSCRNHNCC